MGHRHTILTDEIFKDSKYIKYVERTNNIKNFRKEYEDQYKIILDIYQTFIKLNNCFFSDSNKNKADKAEHARTIIEELVYINYENSQKHKYTVRDIKELFDKRARRLYKYMEQWQKELKSVTYKNANENENLENMINTIEKQMQELEYAEFDSVSLENVSYQKNYIPDYKHYKKYLSKFDNIYAKSNDFKQEFKQKLYDINGVKLDDNDLNKLGLLFKLLSSLNNGLVNIITDYKLDIELTHGNTPDMLYKLYLKSCNIDYENDNFIDNSNDFLAFSGIIKNKIDEELHFDNNILHERFDLFFFYLTMEQCFYSHKIKVKSDYINKLLTDLIEIYKQFKEIRKIEKELSLEEIKKQYFIPLYKKTNEMITKRYGDVYERIS